MKKVNSVIVAALMATCLAGCSPVTVINYGRLVKQGIDSASNSSASSAEDDFELNDILEQEYSIQNGTDFEYDDSLDDTDDASVSFGEPKVTSSGAYIYVSDEVWQHLNNLETDYSKVNWGVVYSPDDMEGLVISIAPYSDGYSSFLIVGLTNLYDKDIAVSAGGYAKDTSGNKTGDLYVYETCIGPGNTAIQLIYCDSVPTGEIHWDEISLENVYRESAAWEADWVIKTDEYGYPSVPYSIYSESNMSLGSVWGFILDSQGNILGCSSDYNAEAGTNLSGSISYYNEVDLTGVSLALFANPVKEND